MTAPPELLGAIAQLLTAEERARQASDRELAADLARARERIDEYGNVIEVRFERIEHSLETQIEAKVAAAMLQVKDGETGPAGETGPPGEPGPVGETGPAGPPGPPGTDAYPGTARGRYRDGETYRALDVVAFNGSEWRARCDDPGPLPGEGWMLGAKGQKGERGERGERGVPGPAGPPGPRLERAAIAEGFVLVLEHSDGSRVACDLWPAFDRFRQELAA